MANEYEILKKGSVELSIPVPLEKDDENHVLVMSYIVGDNVCDLINDAKVTFEDKTKIAEQLADWLVKFHSFFKTEARFRLRGDPSLRNFIISRGHLYGVDFEESHEGKPVEDVAGTCGSILSTDPMFTDEKFHLCEKFLEAYRRTAAWTIENVNAEIAYALLERIQWRPKDEELLRKVASKIRTKGLHAARHNHKIV